MEHSMRTSMKVLLFLLSLSTVGYSQSINLDIGGASGVPGPNYGGPVNQRGFWNLLDSASSTSLVDLPGAATSVSVAFEDIQQTGGKYICSGFFGVPLVNDNFYWNTGGGWLLTFSNLSNGTYGVTLIAPGHSAVPSGYISVNGDPIMDLNGSCSMLEGTDWITVVADVTEGEIAINGTRNNVQVGIAGVQLTMGYDPHVFSDGFETGDTSAWSSVVLTDYDCATSSSCSQGALTLRGRHSRRDGRITW